MPRNARIAVIVFALLGLVCLLAAVWYPEHIWKLLISSAILFVTSMVIMAVVSPKVNNR